MQDIILNTIVESFDRIRYAIPVVTFKRSILLGLSTAGDWRKGKWCFVGGHIKPYENAYAAAIREAKEEANISIKCTDRALIENQAMYIRSEVMGSVKNLRANDEFAALGFFNYKQLKSLKLCDNVIRITKSLKIF
jgi:8-oxo-dGTP pyrophosphatase MutT (NUDIX family)